MPSVSSTSGNINDITAKLVSCNQDSMELIFYLGDYNILTENKEGKIYNKIQTGKSSSLFLEVTSPLPSYSLTIGIPHGKKGIIRNIEASGIVRHRELNFRQGEVRKSRAELENLGFFRLLKVARLTIYPFSYDKKNCELTIYKRLNIKIDFVPDGDSMGERVPVSLEYDPEFEEFYEKLVVNFDQARRWLSKEETTSSGDYVLPDFIIYLNESGIYHVTYESLRNARVPVDEIDPSTLQLFNKNKEVAIYFSREEDSSFDPGDFFDFYGVRNTEEGYYYSNWSDDNPYFMRWGFERGERIKEVRSSEIAGKYYPYFPYYKHFEENRLYDGMEFGTDGDSWMWESAWAGESISFELSIEDPAQTSENAYLKISCQGISSLDHHLVLYINGTEIGDLFWFGAGNYTYPGGESDPPLSFPNDLLRDGTNIFRITCPGDTPARTAEAFYFNWVEIHYFKKFEIQDEGEFIFRGCSEETILQKFNLKNLEGSDYDIYNVISGEKIIDYERSGDEIIFSVPASIKDWFYCIDDSSKKTPAKIEKYEPSGLRSKDNGADYLIITTRKFIQAVEPLARWREEEGLRVKIADVADIYKEFGYGLYHSSSIRNFTKYAFRNWREPPISYVLLVGDATWDRKKRIKEPEGFESFKSDFVPSHLNPARDDFFVYLTEGDEIPDACIGRFPAENKAQVIRMVNKVILYEGFPEMSEWWRNAVFVNGGDLVEYYRIVADDIKKFFPEGWNFTDIFKDVTPETSPYNQMILDAFNEGASFLTFQGHGSSTIWDSPDFFNNRDAQNIDNKMKLPMVLNLSCHTGRFAEPNMNSISEYLTTHSSDLSGAICFWGSSGWSIVDVDSLLTKRFYENIFNKGIEVVGKAILESKISVLGGAPGEGEGDVSTYVASQVFLGDPALRLAIPPNPTTPTGVRANIDLKGVMTISWNEPPDPRITGYRLYYTRTAIGDFNGADGISDLISGDFLGKTASFSTENYLEGTYLFYVSSQAEEDILSHPSQVARLNAENLPAGSLSPSIYFGNTDYDGSTLRFNAYVQDDDDNLEVQLYYQGLKTGLILKDDGLNGDYVAGDGLYSLTVSVGEIPSGYYLTEIRAEDPSGNKGDFYPYLTVHGWNDAYYPDKSELPSWQSIYPADIACNENSPIILYAGYEDTYLTSLFGGELKIISYVADPEGNSDIDRVEVYFNGLYTGIDMIQREDFDDLTKFSLRIPLEPSIMNSSYLLQLIAFDKEGNPSKVWPYLPVE